MSGYMPSPRTTALLTAGAATVACAALLAAYNRSKQAAGESRAAAKDEQRQQSFAPPPVPTSAGEVDGATIAIMRRTWKEEVYPPATDSFDPVDNIMILYNKMFELDKEQEALFHGRDVRVEAKRFAKMFGTILTSLDQERGHTIIQDMGRRHVVYGIKPRMFEVQAVAVLHMAGTVMGPRFTPEVKEAWTKTYAHIVKHMKLGALQDPDAKAMGY